MPEKALKTKAVCPVCGARLLRRVAAIGSKGEIVETKAVCKCKREFVRTVDARALTTTFAEIKPIKPIEEVKVIK